MADKDREREIEEEILRGIRQEMSELDPTARARLHRIMSALAGELSDSMGDGEATLFCGSDGNVVVRGFHYPHSVLGEDGPVILPSSSPDIVLGAYSDEYINRAADALREEYDDSDEREAEWENFMNLCAVAIAEKAREEAPFDFAGVPQEWLDG